LTRQQRNLFSWTEKMAISPGPVFFATFATFAIFAKFAKFAKFDYLRRFMRPQPGR
jgi:hypothetical protein